jgi:nitroimidazol reductase NimA-like FMN-containing flavoprotein (pyridoxamine 5'-phosphate oxidase superfamily)
MSYKLNQSDLEYTLLNGTYLVLGLLNLDKDVETIPMMYVWDKDNFTFHYKSIIIHGKPKEIIDEITKRKSMTLVCEKYFGENYSKEPFQRS